MTCMGGMLQDMLGNTVYKKVVWIWKDLLRGYRSLFLFSTAPIFK